MYLFNIYKGKSKIFNTFIEYKPKKLFINENMKYTINYKEVLLKQI